MSPEQLETLAVLALPSMCSPMPLGRHWREKDG